MLEFLSNLKFAWRYAKGQKCRILLFALSSLIISIIGAIIPLLSARIIVELTSNELKQLIYISIVLLVVQLFRNVIQYLNNYFVQVIYREIFTNTQKALGTEILKLQNKTLDSHSSGVFIQRLIGDTSRLIFSVLICLVLMWQR